MERDEISASTHSMKVGSSAMRRVRFSPPPPGLTLQGYINIDGFLVEFYGSPEGYIRCKKRCSEE